MILPRPSISRLSCTCGFVARTLSHLAGPGLAVKHRGQPDHTRTVMKAAAASPAARAPSHAHTLPHYPSHLRQLQRVSQQLRPALPPAPCGSRHRASRLGLHPGCRRNSCRDRPSAHVRTC
eukprot:349898-Chlamydomonas_euryale.AAC.3